MLSDSVLGIVANCIIVVALLLFNILVIKCKSDDEFTWFMSVIISFVIISYCVGNIYELSGGIV